MDSNKTPYSKGFYSTYAANSYQSARVVVPAVQRFVPAERVVDVGCGVGAWLRVWQDLGASSILGIDGDYVTPDSLRIDCQHFISMDLTHPHPVPGVPFDLAQSLEVGEHLPAAAAAGFVDFLCSLAPVVLFSAAIPHQGGTSHLNEQWPEYWAELFDARGYSVVDAVRPQVWNNPEIAYYYAQNVLLFANREGLEKHPLLEQARASCALGPLAKVHPRKWEKQVCSVPRFEDLIVALPASALMFGKRALQRAQKMVNLPSRMDRLWRAAKLPMRFLHSPSTESRREEAQ
jgi:SAM-dependent methyltransferase